MKRMLSATSRLTRRPAHASKRFTATYKDFLGRGLIILLGVVAVELWIWALTI